MVDVRIYAEGGGDGQVLDTLFRQGWNQFFKKAGLARMPRVVRGKGRVRTFDLFRTAVNNSGPNTLPLLLVDCEVAIQDGHTVWQHLKARDQWDQPHGAADDQAFLMVQVMETWFVADSGLLREYFGSAFNESSVPKWSDLESVSKPAVLKALDSATAGCKTGYSKGKISFELLSRLNPTLVEQKCPHARNLLDRLRAL